MAGIFDSIPIITVASFALGLVGKIVYETLRSELNSYVSRFLMDYLEILDFQILQKYKKRHHL